MLPLKHTPEGKQFTDIVLEVFKLSALLILEGDKLTKELGLSSARCKVMSSIVNSQSLWTVPQISRSMGQTRQAVQRLANELEGDGLLSFKTNPHHKRAKLLTLTEKGKRKYNKLTQKLIPKANAIADEISASELRLTSSVLRKLTNKLETLGMEIQ